MERKHLYFNIILAAALIVLAFLVVRPYIAALVFAAVLAYICYPWHLKLASKTNQYWSATIFSVAAISVLLVIIQYGIITLIFEFTKLPTLIENIDFGALASENFEHMGFSMEGLVRKGLSLVVSNLYDIVYKIPQTIVSLLVFFFSFFYFLKDGDKLVTWVKSITPFPQERRKVMFAEIQKYIGAFIKVQVVIGVVQGVVAGLGFLIFGLPYALPAAVFATVLSILPVIGPYLLYIPVGVVIILTGNVAGGVALLVYGLAIGSALDYIVRPSLTGKYARVHPMIVLIGILGGLVSMGAIGIIVGPVVLTVLAVVIEHLKKEGYLGNEA